MSTIDQNTGIIRLEERDPDWVKILFDEYIPPGSNPSNYTKGLLDGLLKFFNEYLNDPRDIYSGLNTSGGSVDLYKVRVSEDDIENYLGDKIQGLTGIEVSISGSTNKVVDVSLEIQESSSTGTSLLENGYTVKKLTEGIGINIISSDTEVDIAIDEAFLEGITYGIKYAWNNEAEMFAETGMADDDLGVRNDLAQVWKYDEATFEWEYFFDLGTSTTGKTTVSSVPTESYSGTKTTQQGVNEETVENFDNVYNLLLSNSPAYGDLVGDPLPQAVSSTETVATWSTVNQSNNTDVWEFNEANNEVLIKKAGFYTWNTQVTLTNSSNQTRNLIFSTRDKNNPTTYFYTRTISIGRDGDTTQSSITFEVPNDNTTIEIMAHGETLAGTPNDDLTLTDWNTSLLLNFVLSPELELETANVIVSIPADESLSGIAGNQSTVNNEFKNKSIEQDIAIQELELNFGKVFVDGDDTGSEYLTDKLAAGDNITITEEVDGGGEKLLRIASTGGGTVNELSGSFAKTDNDSGSIVQEVSDNTWEILDIGSFTTLDSVDFDTDIIWDDTNKRILNNGTTTKKVKVSFTTNISLSPEGAPAVEDNLLVAIRDSVGNIITSSYMRESDSTNLNDSKHFSGSYTLELTPNNWLRLECLRNLVSASSEYILIYDFTFSAVEIGTAIGGSGSGTDDHLDLINIGTLTHDQLELAINANGTAIVENETDIATNTLDIQSVEEDITFLREDTDLNTSAITSLDTRVTTNEGSIITNAGNIIQNTSDIADNATNIGINALNIATNNSDITALDTRVSTNESDITNIENELSNLSVETINPYSYKIVLDDSIPNVGHMSLNFNGLVYDVKVSKTNEGLAYTNGIELLKAGDYVSLYDNLDIDNIITGYISNVVDEGSYMSFELAYDSIGGNQIHDAEYILDVKASAGGGGTGDYLPLEGGQMEGSIYLDEPYIPTPGSGTYTLENTDTKKTFSKIIFLQNNTIMAINEFNHTLDGYEFENDHLIYFSYDNGVTWTETTIPPVDGDGIYHIYDIYQRNSGRIIACGASIGHRGRILYSDDNGVTWTVSYSNLDNASRLWSITESQGVVYISGYTIFHSSTCDVDSWDEILVDEPYIDFIPLIQAVANNRLIIVVYNATSSNNIYYSDDNGLNWKIPAGDPLMFSTHQNLFVSSTGRIFASGHDLNISDDNGTSFEILEYTSNVETDELRVGAITELSNGRILFGSGLSWLNATENMRLFYSYDDGENVFKDFNFPDIPINSMAVNGDTVIYGCLESVYSSNDTNITAEDPLNISIHERFSLVNGEISELDTRVTTNENDITALDTRVSTNESDITALDTRITDNTANITENSSDIDTLEQQSFINTSDIAALDVRVTDLEDDDTLDLLLNNILDESMSGDATTQSVTNKQFKSSINGIVDYLKGFAGAQTSLETAPGFVPVDIPEDNGAQTNYITIDFAIDLDSTNEDVIVVDEVANTIEIKENGSYFWGSLFHISNSSNQTDHLKIATWDLTNNESVYDTVDGYRSVIVEKDGYNQSSTTFFTVDNAPIVVEIRLLADDDTLTLESWDGVLATATGGGGGITETTDLLLTDGTTESISGSATTQKEANEEVVGNIGNVGTKEVDETNIADGNVATYDLASDKVVYTTPSSGGGTTTYANWDAAYADSANIADGSVVYIKETITGAGGTSFWAEMDGTTLKPKGNFTYASTINNSQVVTGINDYTTFIDTITPIGFLQPGVSIKFDCMILTPGDGSNKSYTPYIYANNTLVSASSFSYVQEYIYHGTTMVYTGTKLYGSWSDPVEGNEFSPYVMDDYTRSATFGDGDILKFYVKYADTGATLNCLKAAFVMEFL